MQCKKFFVLKTCKSYDFFFGDYKLDIQEDNLYYPSYDNTYIIYNFDTADYIGIYPVEYFGTYKLFISKQRDKKIEEILKD